MYKRQLLVLAEGEQRNVQYAVGFYYENGVKTQVDLEKAAQWYKKAADQGHEEAQLHLGLLYAQGKGVEQDYQKAVSWLRRAANQGNANAQYNICLLYTSPMTPSAFTIRRGSSSIRIWVLMI